MKAALCYTPCDDIWNWLSPELEAEAKALA